MHICLFSLTSTHTHCTFLPMLPSMPSPKYHLPKSLPWPNFLGHWSDSGDVPQVGSCSALEKSEE